MHTEMLAVAIADRRDFYHQFRVSDQRACSNAVFPPLSVAEVQEFKAFDRLTEFVAGLKKNKERTSAGDFLHGKPGRILIDEKSEVVAAFGALYQGDHLGVEFATDAHAALMKSGGLLPESSRLQGGHFILEDQVSSGLIIDDFFVISKEAAANVVSMPHARAVRDLEVAKGLYSQEGLIGSDDKDVLGDVRFKVCGAEVISTWSSVQRGLVVAGAPYDKRLSLGLLTSFAAVHGFTSDALHACLVGSWVSVLMMRRQAMAFVNELFKVIPAEELDVESPKLRLLPRAAADEMCVLAALSPILASNLAAPFDCTLYATDASNAKGGICSAEVPLELAKVLWRSADRVGKNLPLLSSPQSILMAHDELYEHEVYDDDAALGQLHPDRPIGMRFDFIEICGGAGVVTKELIKLGVCCGPIVDVSLSPQYNLCKRRVVEWIVFLLEDDRLQSFLVAPPCTTFSPAAHPACRSYLKPRGFNPQLPKVRIGNLLAFASLTLLLVALRLRKFGLCETTRRSKMRWLAEWKRLLLLGAEEVNLASCAYGSVHQKEFGMMGVNMKVGLLHRKCTRDHEHVRIQGKFTRPSATYCSGLAIALAVFFADHIRAHQAARDRLEINSLGLEDVLSNDVAVSLDWKIEGSWRWRAPAHINVLETAATVRMLRNVARQGGDKRLVYLVDSHVSRSIMAKGRSSSAALRRMLKTVAAICLAFGLYPAGRFCPTRLNPADHPTRDTQLPTSISSILDFDSSPTAAFAFLASLAHLKRWISNWLRLTMRLAPGTLDFHVLPFDSLRRHAPCVISNQEWSLDFDSTLGFPGEGPTSLLWIFFLSLAWGFLGVCGAGARGASHGDAVRKMQRAGIVLNDGRRVTETTSFHREGLLGKFRDWLVRNGYGFDQLVMSSPPDLDLLNQKLVDYGRWLFSEGKPYYHFAETINAVTSCRPLVRRSLQQAWDLAFLWNSHEPAEHHVAMPYQVLVALLTLCWTWGWKREAAVFALAFGALLRIGEIVDATRKDLIMPADVSFTLDHVLLRIHEPKTRFRAARHQAGKVEQPDLIEVIRIGFARLQPCERLWPLSGSTLRLRLTRLLERLDLPSKDLRGLKALSLASFRPGGATWLMGMTESAELVRRRGRWASFRIMEIYLQEVMAATYTNDIPKTAYQKVMTAFQMFPQMLLQAKKFEECRIPEVCLDEGSWAVAAAPLGQ